MLENRTNVKTINTLYKDFHTKDQIGLGETLRWENLKGSFKARRGKNIKGKRVLLLLLIFRPLVIFLKKYVFKLGFLDGYYGFVVCVLSAYTTFLKDIKLRELRKKKDL